RTFAMETGLYAAYDLMLDTGEAVAQTVDQYLSELQPDSAARDWIADMTEQRIDDGRSWNCRQDLIPITEVLLREDSQAISDDVFRKISDRDAVRQYGVRLRKIRQAFESAMKQDARDALRIMESNNLTIDDFSNKQRGFAGLFVKLLKDKPEPPGKRAEEACGNLEKWYSKNTEDGKKIAIAKGYEQGMNAALGRILARWQAQGSDYVTAGAILPHLPELGIMADMHQALRRYCSEQEVFLISQSNLWLRKIIDGADAPFIYERTGTHFRHYMIDEMQDTSQMQWDNLLPLLRDSMARGYAGWTVGDVKQSIYRFRNSDWRIMAGQIGRDIPSAVEKHLQYNFRSEARIINFNNLFFKTLCAQLANRSGQWDESWKDLFLNIYSDVAQKVPEKKAAAPDGFVEMRFISGQKGSDWKKEALRALPGQLMELQDLGYGAADIAVLVRSNKDAATVVEYMLQWVQEHPEYAGKYVFDMLYNEALYIDDNLLVQWVIGALKYMTGPQEEINRTFLAYAAAQCLPEHPDDIFGLLDDWSDRCRSLSVYDAVAALTEDLDLYSHTDDAPFLQAFQDFLLKYCRRERVDTAAFLSYWQDHQSKEHLMMPEQQEAVRLMTIHKAKGLEFDAVLMPLADWDTGSGHNHSVWMSTAGTAFDDLPQVLVTPSAKLENSIFAAQFAWESFLSCIDNVNLLYVAFTRAGKVLMAQAPEKDEGTAATVARWIRETCREGAETADGWTWEDASADRPYAVCRTGVLTPRPGRAAEDRRTDRRLNDLYRPVMRNDSGIQ
ncbi:MAG: UvrD-helicase domain-containing protein, partial [Bacteroidales bacterium]|nr:UvrD-helicase domain-containing protein [Bacteroidales bacterium]